MAHGRRTTTSKNLRQKPPKWNSNSRHVTSFKLSSDCKIPKSSCFVVWWRLKRLQKHNIYQQTKKVSELLVCNMYNMYAILYSHQVLSHWLSICCVACRRYDVFYEACHRWSIILQWSKKISIEKVKRHACSSFHNSLTYICSEYRCKKL